MIVELARLLPRIYAINSFVLLCVVRRSSGQQQFLVPSGCMPTIVALAMCTTVIVVIFRDAPWGVAVAVVLGSLLLGGVVSAEQLLEIYRERETTKRLQIQSKHPELMPYESEDE